MTALKSKILKTIKSKRINVLLLFFLLAFAILVLTKLSNDYTDTLTLNVETSNVPEEFVVLNDSTHKLKVTLTTHGFKWLKHYMWTPKVNVDFVEDVSRLDSSFVWSKSKGYLSVSNQFDKKTKILSINPDSLKFRYDVNTVKYLPIIANTNISYEPGYNVLNAIEIDPDSVKVIGPATLLSKLEYLETEDFEKKAVKTSINSKIPLQLDGLNGAIRIAVKEVTLRAEVEKFTEGTLNLPIQVINVPNGMLLKHFPKSVKVSYYTSLNAFNSITVSDFKVVCDYNDIQVNSSYLTPFIVKQPKVVKSTRLHQQKIEFIIAE